VKAPPCEALALVVDRQGIIAEVLHDGLKLTTRAARGAPFADLCHPTSVDKGTRFLGDLQSSGVVREWELAMGRRRAGVLLHFCGAVIDEELVIVGGKTPRLIVSLFESMVRDDHGHARKIGALLEAQLIGRAVHLPAPELFDQLSQLNDELAAMERELARQNLALQRENLLLGTVAHDLRTPLGVISTSATIVLSGAPGALTPAQRKAVERIERSARFMTTLVEDLLDLSTIESGKLTLHRTEFDLCAEIGDMVRCYQVLAEGKAIQIDVVAPEPLPWVGDRSRIRRALNNLVDNAIKFSHPGSSVQVKCSREGSRIGVSVIDRGLGIERGKLDELFEPHGGTGACGTAGEPSTGLGLLIARGIIEAHGGHISVESEVGEGCTFRFELPAG
jgi:two-component system, OmpR family, sensor kinase